SSSGRHELHAHRHRTVHRAASWRQPAGFWVNSKYDQTVAVLIGHDEERARRIDAKIAGRLDSLPLMADRTEFPCRGIDGKDRNAVVAAIGAVDESAGRMHLNFRG